MFFEPVKLNRVLQYKRVKFTAEELQNESESFDTKWKKSFMDQIDVDAVLEINAVYSFKHTVLDKCAIEFTYWLQRYPEFYHDDYHVVLETIRARLQRFLEEDGMYVPKINWAPHYGGKLQNGKSVEKGQLSWLADNGNRYFLTGEPVREETSD